MVAGQAALTNTRVNPWFESAWRLTVRRGLALTTRSRGRRDYLRRPLCETLPVRVNRPGLAFASALRYAAPTNSCRKQSHEQP